MSIRPFSCGTQYLDWSASNCVTCKKSGMAPPQCDIERALISGCFGDGTVTESIAKRMGWVKGPAFHYIWECPEREPK